MVANKKNPRQTTIGVDKSAVLAEARREKRSQWQEGGVGSTTD
jgi:hypothetical protein